MTKVVDYLNRDIPDLKNRQLVLVFLGRVLNVFNNVLAYLYL